MFPIEHRLVPFLSVASHPVLLSVAAICLASEGPRDPAVRISKWQGYVMVDHGTGQHLTLTTLSC